MGKAGQSGRELKYDINRVLSKHQNIKILISLMHGNYHLTTKRQSCKRDLCLQVYQRGGSRAGYYVIITNPSGTRFRSTREIQNHLEKNGDVGLKGEEFSFSPFGRSLSGVEMEVAREEVGGEEMGAREVREEEEVREELQEEEEDGEELEESEVMEKVEREEERKELEKSPGWEVAKSLGMDSLEYTNMRIDIPDFMQ